MVFIKVQRLRLSPVGAAPLTVTLGDLRMSVDDRNVVDGIGVEKQSPIVVLTISDHRIWGDRDHLQALQNKINDYFGFIESGQLLESYPNAAEKKIRIDVICQYSPDTDGEQLLLKANQVAESVGWSVSWLVLDKIS